MNVKNIVAEIIDFLKTTLIFLVILILLRVFIFATFEVSGESMANNFHDGDKLIVSKLSYVFDEPERFDVIVFKATPELDFIKRVIGLPGDKIEYKDNILYVNDQAIEEIFLDFHTNDFKLEDLLEYDTVPQDHVFVLGDNRTNSTDSRVPGIGFISYEQIIGKTTMRYMPFSKVDFGVGGNQRLN